MLDWGLHRQGGGAWGFGSKTRPNHIDYRCTWHLAVGRPFTTKSSARARGHVAVDSSAKVLDINRTAAHLAHTYLGTHAQQVARARVRAVRPVCIGLARAMIILTHSLGQQGISFAKSFCTNKSSLASSFPACLLSACFDFVREMRMEIPAEQLAKRKD